MLAIGGALIEEVPLKYPRLSGPGGAVRIAATADAPTESSRKQRKARALGASARQMQGGS